jgi:hypothetical protein
MVSPITLARRFKEHPNGTFRGRNGLRALKDDKMCTVRDVSGDSLENVTDLIVFPLNDNHIEHFKQAAKGVRAHGPAMANPGAIGTVSLKRMGEGPYFLDYAQAHYTTPVNGKKTEKYLPRSLATKYGGWRQRAFKFAMRLAKEEEKELVVPHTVFVSGRKDPTETQMYKDMRKVCDEEGLDLEPSVNYARPAFVIRPK